MGSASITVSGWCWLVELLLFGWFFVKENEADPFFFFFFNLTGTRCLP